MRSVGAWVVPHQVSVSESDKRIGEQEANIDAAIYNRLLKLGGDVAKFSKLMAAGIIDPSGMEEV